MPQLFFKKIYQDAIRAGEKSTTIRRWDRPMVKAGQVAFSPGLGWLSIEAVDPVELEALDDSDATADGFKTARQMRRLLRSLYPAYATDGKQWFRIKFRMRQEIAQKHHNAPTLFS
jgi:hypothetical protein